MITAPRLTATEAQSYFAECLQARVGVLALQLAELRGALTDITARYQSLSSHTLTELQLDEALAAIQRARYALAISEDRA